MRKSGLKNEISAHYRLFLAYKVRKCGKNNEISAHYRIIFAKSMQTKISTEPCRTYGKSKDWKSRRNFLIDYINQTERANHNYPHVRLLTIDIAKITTYTILHIKNRIHHNILVQNQNTSQNI